MPWSTTPVKLWRQVTLRRLHFACRSYDTAGLHVYKTLGAQSHGPHDPCLRFAAEVTLVPRKTRLRLATTLFPRGIFTRKIPIEGLCPVQIMTSPFARLPGAP